MNTTSKAASGNGRLSARAETAGEIGEAAFLETLRRHREHGRLRVEQREMGGLKAPRDGRAEKTGTAADLENAIRREEPQTADHAAGRHYQIPQGIEQPGRIFDRIPARTREPLPRCRSIHAPSRYHEGL
jgi:hypothetical protein